MGQGLLSPLEALDAQARNRVLLEALDQPECGYWAANLPAAFPDPSFVPLLQRRLIHPDTDADSAGAVATALEAIETSQPGGAAGRVLEQDYRENPRWAPIQAREAQASKAADIVMRKMSCDRILPTAEEAFRSRDYRRVVPLLAPYTARDDGNSTPWLLRALPPVEARSTPIRDESLLRAPRAGKMALLSTITPEPRHAGHLSPRYAQRIPLQCPGEHPG